MADGKHFNELLFLKTVEVAQRHVKKILHTERSLVPAADVPHAYADKFSLSEFCTNLALSALQDVFTPLGLDMQQHGDKVREWITAGQSLTLRLQATEHCNFLRESSHEVESGKTRVQKSSFFGLIKSDKTSSVFTTIKDYYFNLKYEWKVILYAGTDAGGGIILRGRTGELEVRRAHRQPPMPLQKEVPPIETCVGGMSSHAHLHSYLQNIMHK